MGCCWLKANRLWVWLRVFILSHNCQHLHCSLNPEWYKDHFIMSCPAQSFFERFSLQGEFFESYPWDDASSDIMGPSWLTKCCCFEKNIFGCENILLLILLSTHNIIKWTKSFITLKSGLELRNKCKRHERKLIKARTCMFGYDIYLN